MVQKFIAIPIGGFAELPTLMRRPTIATGLWIPLGESALLDDPAAERIQRFLGLISLICAFSRPAARRNGRQLSAYPGRPWPPLPQLDSTGRLLYRYRRSQSGTRKFQFVLSRTVKRRVDAQPNSLR